jgi:hypothetical protein
MVVEGGGGGIVRGEWEKEVEGGGGGIVRGADDDIKIFK